MKVTVLRGASSVFAIRSFREAAFTRGQRTKNRIQVLNRRIRSSDHQAEPALQSPDSAACANVQVMNAAALQIAGSSNIVNVIRVSPIDEDIVRLELWRNFGNRVIHDRRRNHEPYTPRQRKF